MYRNSATLEDVYRLALPQGTEILFGADLLTRPVSWACSLRPSPPAFPKLTGNELALVDMEDLRQLDPRMRLDRVIQSLQQARVAALAVLGEVPKSAISAAEANQMPLFALSITDPLVQVERSVIRLIVDREGYIAARAADIQRELTQLELDGRGMDAIAARLHQFVQQPVIFLRDDGQVTAQAGLADLADRLRERLLAGLPNILSLRSWAASQKTQSLGEAVGVLKLGDERLPYTQSVVAPIVAGERVQGYCLLLRAQSSADANNISTVEAMGALQGAGVAALEWSRQHAVGAIQEQMRATFLDDLLASEIADEQAWIQRGKSLGYDLSAPHAAWLIEAENIPDWPNPLFQFIHAQRAAIPTSRRSEGILLFWPLENPKSARQFKAVANDLIEALVNHTPKANVVIGIGRPATRPGEWLRTLQQAQESWHMGKSWHTSPVTYFGDLGLYQLLTALGGNPEAARFFRKTVRPLLDHDENRNAELVETLEAFFACHGNLSQTAARLHIHRNTLTYRLERISAITRLDLDDPDARFSLQLALKLRPVLKNRF
ncbi:MAG: helix-turn-helix domain-containing protein [Caldilineaceae bacterium]|nr:helix-turn-helix domain-containing protein [Caldilineaceae bacterium]